MTRFKHFITAAASMLLCSSALAGNPKTAAEPQPAPLTYNNPGLIVDLGVGLWAYPVPVTDANGNDIWMVGSGGQSGKGLFKFVPTGTTPEGIPIFTPGEQLFSLSRDQYETLSANVFAGKIMLTVQNSRWPDFKPVKQKLKWEPLVYKPDFPFSIPARNQWYSLDYDKDGILDLIVVTNENLNEYRLGEFDKEGHWLGAMMQSRIYWVKNLGSNESPKFAEPAIPLRAAGEIITRIGPACPAFADFDGDGKTDMICGEVEDSMRFYRNIGDNHKPVYDVGRDLKLDGKILKMELTMIRPAALDYDHDGKIDLVVGEEDGRVAVLRNTGKKEGDGTPVFAHPQYLRQVADRVKIGVLSTPCAVDWDDDGDSDLIVGDSAGYISLLENLSGPGVAQPRWAAPVRLAADGQTIRILAGYNGSIQGPLESKWGYTSVTAADWNNDGKLDLIVNSIWGKIIWFENIGTRGKPVLAAAKPIEVEYQNGNPCPPWNWWKPSGKELVMQWRCSVQILDVNGDGLPDLVGVDPNGYLAAYERFRDRDGQLKLHEPKRIFLMANGENNAFDWIHNPVRFNDVRGRNQLTTLDADGQLAYYGRSFNSAGTMNLEIVKRHPLLPPAADADFGRALRLNAGWGGTSGRRNFIFTDWDGDGKLDLLVNSININFLKNVATEPGKFVFKDMGPICRQKLAGHSTCPSAVNWKNSGSPDLVIGDECGYLWFFPNPNNQGKK